MLLLEHNIATSFMHDQSENITLPIDYNIVSTVLVTNNITKVLKTTPQSTCNKQSRFMQNYQNTPRVSTVQNQSRIQSLTFSQLSQPKTVQKIRNEQYSASKTNNPKLVPKIQQWIPRNTANPEISHKSQQTATINPTIPSQSINQSI